MQATAITKLTNTIVPALRCGSSIHDAGRSNKLFDIQLS